MSNFMDIKDDDSLMHSKEFIELATQDTKSQPESGEAEAEILEVSGADTQAWLLKVWLWSLRKTTVNCDASSSWTHVVCLTW